MAEELEATRKKRRTEHREQAEVAAASSESPRPPATPDSKPESPAPVAPETLTATAVAAGKGRARKKEEVVVALAAAVGMEEKKKRKRSRHVEAAAIPLPSAATAHVLEVAEKGAVARKEQRQGKVVQEQSGQLPFPIDAHPQGGEAPVNGGVSGIHCVKMDRFGKPRVLSKKQMVKVQIDFLKQHRKSRVFIPTIVNPSSIDHDPKYSSPCGALLFDQFSYKPDRRQGRSAPSLPKTPEPPARPLSRDHLSSRSSQVTANETFMDANTTILNTKQPRSASASGPQEEVEVEEKKRPEKNMSRMKKPGKPSPLLSAAENRSDKYHRIPLNQLVHPPCSLGINSLKKHQKPQVFIPTVVNPNSVDPDPKYSSPYGALLFDQFSYKPDRRQGRSAPSLPKTPDPLARPLSRDHLSSRSSQLTANEAFMDANTTILNTKQPCSASASGPQEEVEVEEKKRPEKNMSRMKKPGKPSPLLSAAENRSDKYRRLPLNELVRPPRSPHKLLQEKYASDPWKVMVICMLLNQTQGKQVRKKVKGFFRRYPDAQTAFKADPEKMAEYLAPLGLQRVKTNRIQKFSKGYVQEEWKYVTELCGVGKYAADAYAIFCAGRATDVVPEDHKLVDYWKYVCFELPLIQASRNAQDFGVTTQGNFAPEVKQVALSC